MRRGVILALGAVLMAGGPWGRASDDAPTPTPTPATAGDRRSSALPLDLAGDAGLAPVELDLEPGPAPDSGPPSPGIGRMVLELGPPRDPARGLDLGPLEHPPDWIVPGDRDRWPSSDPPVQRHAAAELDRVASGQPWGRAPAVILFDGVKIVEAAGRLLRRWREGRRPPGALVPTDGAAVVRVTESSGPLPATISVIPLAEGWVGDAVHGTCDESGRCEVRGLPNAPSVLLVIGTGGAVVAHPGGDATLDVALRPLGRLRLDPRRPGAAVRILAADSQLAVPVVRWLNPGRGEWLELDGVRVLYLPEGEYVVEARTGSARTATRVRVDRDRTAVARVP